ncbi:hypothetical protein QBC38DRAFT_97475 [Podospora fimiseda]|uniref:Major facilitator superfamily transporter n=1 Tax=Podospora fimiseda TaxID=252190 RepID=A0AAN7BUB3_9PEZI|nr:hypothetical protein QBC38DRAFT_97475 [Podospora fimiseda]
MERPPFMPRSKSNSFSSSIFSREDLTFLREEKTLLPYSNQPKPPKIRVRTLLGHCLYRRVFLWSVGFLLLLWLTLSSNKTQLRRERIFRLVNFGEDDPGDTGGGPDDVVYVVRGGDETTATELEDDDIPKWMRFRRLDGFFNGIKALVPAAEHQPEYPRDPATPPLFPLTLSYTGMPTPTPYAPHPDYDSSEYTSKYHAVKTCYLDKENTIPVPDVYAYSGVVQGQPDPVMGSYNLLGIRDDICFDRFGRYGPYGLGYSFNKGGSHVGTETEQTGNSAVWKKTGKIDYSGIDWGDVQSRCYEANKQRFITPPEEPIPTMRPASATSNSSKKKKNQNVGRSFLSRGEREQISRTAVVIRAYVGFQWTQHVVLNFRALISEVALRSGGEYTVHFLLHVRDDDEPIFADPLTAQRILDENVPEEFHGICTLWSEDQMRLLYPGKWGHSVEDPSSGDIHGVYRSAHFPLQHFAILHPEYEHFWNWELDMRWVGDYYELFDRLGAWARQQSRVELWERSAKYYIPALHGNWDNFTRLVHEETIASKKQSILGPVYFKGKSLLRSEAAGQSFLPSSCDSGDTECGVGEEADLITLNPLFDTEESGWVFAADVTGYKHTLPIPPRRCSIITASRMSRRLLKVMHEETWRHRHSMFTEMYPATMALHHGLKAVYAPHPVFIDREWDLEELDKAFNGGRDHTAGGEGSPYDLTNEHVHRGTTWYYNSQFAGKLWRRWLGYAQSEDDEGLVMKGGRKEEESPQGTGRLCLRSRLLHPIKWENPHDLDYE